MRHSVESMQFEPGLRGAVKLRMWPTPTEVTVIHPPLPKDPMNPMRPQTELPLSALSEDQVDDYLQAFCSNVKSEWKRQRGEP